MRNLYGHFALLRFHFQRLKTYRDWTARGLREVSTEDKD